MRGLGRDQPGVDVLSARGLATMNREEVPGWFQAGSSSRIEVEQIVIGCIAVYFERQNSVYENLGIFVMV